MEPGGGLRVNGALDNFEVMRSQIGVRNGFESNQLRAAAAIGALGAHGILGLWLSQRRSCDACESAMTFLRRRRSRRVA